ncbi:SPASM domain-containing protein [Acetivibrio straminisolvens]|uniref:SPASM domain-containing protein n=1 Tax=Acetivibrio straminisolvens TaxID=253314 RepID=UPI001FB04E34|nr:SPASM domain-containing protein [Acetivibrio straminisolvens]
MVIPAGRGDDDELTVRYSDIGEMVEEIRKKASMAGVKFMWYSPTPLCLFNPIPAGLGNKGCSACEGLLSVDPEGNILPCSSWAEPMGNLLKEGFEDVWSKKRSKWIRDKQEAPEECKGCKHFDVCQGACPLYFNIHGYEELHSVWKSYGLCKERSTV